MRRTMMAGLILCLAAAPAIGGETSGRTATGEYNTLVVNLSEDPPGANGNLSNGVEFKARRGETAVSFAIEDRSGLPARAIVTSDLDGDGVADTEHEFCGETTEPIALKGRDTLVVSVQEGPCEDGEPAIGTLGTITATFTR